MERCPQTGWGWHIKPAAVPPWCILPLRWPCGCRAPQPTCCWKVEHLHLWSGPRRAAEATASFQAARAALLGQWQRGEPWGAVLRVNGTFNQLAHVPRPNSVRSNLGRNGSYKRSYTMSARGQEEKNTGIDPDNCARHAWWLRPPASRVCNYSARRRGSHQALEDLAPEWGVALWLEAEGGSAQLGVDLRIGQTGPELHMSAQFRVIADYAQTPAKLDAVWACAVNTGVHDRKSLTRRCVGPLLVRMEGCLRRQVERRQVGHGDRAILRQPHMACGVKARNAGKAVPMAGAPCQEVGSGHTSRPSCRST